MSSSTPNPNSQLLKIAQGLPPYDVERTSRGMEVRRREYSEACFIQKRCLELAHLVKIPRLQMACEELCLAHAFQGGNSQQLADALEFYAAYGYLVTLSQKAFKHAENKGEFYTDCLEDLGMRALAAIFVGAPEPSRWLSSEYLRHHVAGQKGEASYDDDFVDSVAFTLRWYVEGKPPAGFAGRRKTFAEVAAAAVANDVAAFRNALALYASTREKEAFRLSRGRGVAANYFSEVFCALFPLEVAVIQKLIADSAQAESPAVPAWLTGLEFSGAAWRDEFVVRCAGTFSALAP